jgi:hypothetical protein
MKEKRTTLLFRKLELKLATELYVTLIYGLGVQLTPWKSVVSGRLTLGRLVKKVPMLLWKTEFYYLVHKGQLPVHF